MDEGSYIIYHQASLGPPCLSFDIIPDDQGENRGQNGDFPLTSYGVAGTQASKSSANSIILYKMFNLWPLNQLSKSGDGDGDGDDDDDNDNEERDAVDDPEKAPKLKIASVKHPGVVNRLRFDGLGGNLPVVAAWNADDGSVGIWSVQKCLEKLEAPTQGKQWYRETDAKPLSRFKGHMTEGYALDWSPTTTGLLASGDCNKNIHVWKPVEGSWVVDQVPLADHADSVEDLQWSPNEQNVLASCSVDKSLKIWDIRAKATAACMLTVKDAHAADVNVIHWNRNEPFIASGGDDGALKIWDLRQLQSGTPVATFGHHKGPVTSVEWHPNDSTVLASSGADDQIALWDLAIEKDDTGAEDGRELNDLPPQLLFIHQGLNEIKELHWHKQIPGLVISTSHTGLDVFRTISV